MNKTDPVSAFLEHTVHWGRQIIKEATVVGVSLGHLNMSCISANGNCMDVMMTFSVWCIDRVYLHC